MHDWMAGTPQCPSNWPSIQLQYLFLTFSLLSSFISSCASLCLCCGCRISLRCNRKLEVSHDRKIVVPIGQSEMNYHCRIPVVYARGHICRILYILIFYISPHLSLPNCQALVPCCLVTAIQPGYPYMVCQFGERESLGKQTFHVIVQPSQNRP